MNQSIIAVKVMESDPEQQKLMEGDKPSILVANNKPLMTKKFLVAAGGLSALVMIASVAGVWYWTTLGSSSTPVAQRSDSSSSINNMTMFAAAGGFTANWQTCIIGPGESSYDVCNTAQNYLWYAIS